MVNSLAAKYPTEFSFLAQPYAFLKSPAFALIIIIVPHDMTEIHSPIGGEHATLIIVHNARKKKLELSNRTWSKSAP